MEIKVRIWIDGREVDLAPTVRSALESSAKRARKKELKRELRGAIKPPRVEVRP